MKIFYNKLILYFYIILFSIMVIYKETKEDKREYKNGLIIGKRGL